MNNTHYLTKTVDGLKHTVQFTVVGTICTISSETWDVEDTLGGYVRKTSRHDWSLVAGRTFYARYVRQGYTA